MNSIQIGKRKCLKIDPKYHIIKFCKNKKIEQKLYCLVSSINGMELMNRGKMSRLIISLLIIFLLASNCNGIFTSSDKISGSGNFNRDYHTTNRENDFAKVSVDVKNATYLEYSYSTYSDEMQAGASEDLMVAHADKIECSGEARNRNNASTYVATSINNGNITYNNSVKASNQGVQAYQDIEASGDGINIEGSALGDNNARLASTMNMGHFEHLQSKQRVCLDEDKFMINIVHGLAGPTEIESTASAEGRTITATGNIAAGEFDLNQTLGFTGSNQNLKGIIGGVRFDTSIENAARNKTHTYAATGSGNIALKQRATANDAHYEMEYEYLPVSYSNGSYSTGPFDWEYATIGSFANSTKDISNDVVANNCEHLQAKGRLDSIKDFSTDTKINAIAGPLKAASTTSEADRTIKTVANVIAGVFSINQSTNLSAAHQDSKGVTGGVEFNSLVENADGNRSNTHAATGSGNLIALKQNATAKGTQYEMEYEYLPVSYSTGIFDWEYATIGSFANSAKDISNDVVANNCEHLQAKGRLESIKDFSTDTKINAIAGPLEAASTTSGSDRTIKTVANVIAGVVSINQSVNLTEANQDSVGVTCGVNFSSSIESGNRNWMQVYSAAGSGNLVSLEQKASGKDEHCLMEYEYMPASYSTGTYDTNLFHLNAKSGDKKGTAIDTYVNATQCDKVRDEMAIEVGMDTVIRHELYSKAPSGRIEWSLAANKDSSSVDSEYYTLINGTITNGIYSDRIGQFSYLRNFTSCDPYSRGKISPWINLSIPIPVPIPVADSIWGRRWTMDPLGGYSVINGLQLSQGTLQFEEVWTVKRADCRWCNMLMKT
jgi:hypothetical protein